LTIKEKMGLLWDVEKNKKSFEEISTKDPNDAYWICDYPGRGCEFVSSTKRVYHALYRRERGKKAVVCPICKEVNFEESIVFHATEKVSKYWDYERNATIGIFPEYTKVFSNEMIYVKCEKHR
jgi:predicted nucleic-acid-binding Zn-ribbon protein